MIHTFIFLCISSLTYVILSQVGENDDDEREDQMSRKYASRKNLFPKERKGCLDVNKLKRHGVTRERLRNKDLLLIYQFILPIHDMQDTKITNDGRIPFYSKKVVWDNNYRNATTRSGRGNRGKEIEIPDEVHFDGILFYSGSDGGGHDIHKRWKKGSSRYLSKIAESPMKYYRWLQVKRFSKLNDNKDGKPFI